MECMHTGSPGTRKGPAPRSAERGLTLQGEVRYGVVGALCVAVVLPFGIVVVVPLGDVTETAGL